MQLQDALKTIGEASYRLKKFGELSSIGSYDMTATAPKARQNAGRAFKLCPRRIAENPPRPGNPGCRRNPRRP